MLNEKGRLGFILPHKFFNSQYGEPLRKLLAQKKQLSEVVHFGDQQIFAGASTYTCLLFLTSNLSRNFHFIKAHNLEAWQRGDPLIKGKIPAEKVTGDEWNFIVGKGSDLFERLNKMPTKLSDVASNIFQGIVTSADPIYILEIREEDSEGYKVYSKFLNTEIYLEKIYLKRFIKGYTIKPYFQPPYRHVLLFPYKSTGLVKWDEIQKKAPQTSLYLQSCKSFLCKHEHGKMGHQNWYAYVYPKNLFHFQKRKLIVQVISQSRRFALDEKDLYFTGGGNGPYYGILLKQDCLTKYILALCNSKLFDFYLHPISSPFRGGYWSYGKRFIEKFPICILDLTSTDDQARRDQMVTLVERMLALHKQLAGAKTPQAKTVLQRQIEATDRQIDRLVYELYDLTEEEIKIVEGSQ